LSFFHPQIALTHGGLRGMLRYLNGRQLSAKC
jgi:hypothetical protein